MIKLASPSRPLKTLRRGVAPEALADQYLYHEFLKIFRDAARDARFRRRLKKSAYGMRRHASKNSSKKCYTRPLSR